MSKRGLFISLALLLSFFSPAWGGQTKPLVGLSEPPVGQTELPVSRSGIFVRPSASVEGEDIRLGEVARVAAEGFAQQMLEEISLGRSPKPGRVKIVSKRQFLLSLRPHQDLVEGMDVEIPDRIYVKRSSQQFAEPDIREYLDDYLGREYKAREVSLERLEIPESGEYPMGQMTMAAADPPRVNRDGRFSISLEIFVDGHKEGRIRVAGRLAVYDTVVVAARRLSRGLPLSPGDGILVRRNIFSLRGETPGRLEGMADKTLTQDVDKGEAILAEWLKPLPLVRKGDVVTLLAQKDSILIQTSGVSREDGSKNDVIEVENIRSGKVVRGLVRKPATVEVIY